MLYHRFGSCSTNLSLFLLDIGLNYLGIFIGEMSPVGLIEVGKTIAFLSLVRMRDYE